MQQTLFNLPTRPFKPAPRVQGPINGADMLLIAPEQVVSRYRAQLALMELYPAHPSVRALARAAELLELPVTHAAVSVCVNAAHDLNRVLRFRGVVAFAEVERLAVVVAGAR